MAASSSGSISSISSWPARTSSMAASASPIAQRLGERADVLPEPVRGVQPRDRRRRMVLEPAHDVGEHRSGLDRRKLVGVADEDEPGRQGAAPRAAEPYG